MSTDSQYVINGNTVTLQEIEVLDEERKIVADKGSVPLPDFLEALDQQVHRQIFFPGLNFGYIIAQASLNGAEVYIVEQKPTKTTISENVDNMREVQKRNIVVPWVYFSVEIVHGQFDTLRVFFSTRRVESANQELGICPLPNLHSREYMVCMSPAVSDELRGISDPARICDAAINSYWSSTFNRDLMDDYTRARERIPHFPQTFAQWDRMSSDPQQSRLFRVMNWQPSGKTINSLLARVDPRSR
jgi:hypothetical protein